MLKQTIGFAAILLLSVFHAKGTTVTPATYAAPATICVGTGFRALTSIVITEEAVGDFANGSGQTYRITLPAGFQFNSGAATILSSTTADITAISGSYISSTSYEIVYTVVGGTVIDAISITGMQVEAISAGGTGDIAFSAGTASMVGNAIGQRSHGTLTSNATPTITTHPANYTYCDQTGAAPFTVVATGGNLSYAWVRSLPGDPTNFQTPPPAFYSGTTTANFQVDDISSAFAGIRIRVAVTNDCGSLNSNVAQISLAPTPTITTQPANNSGCDGAAVTFSVVANSGGFPITYAWQRDRNLGAGFEGPPTDLYSGINTPNFQADAITPAFDGVKVRVRVTSCGITITSSEAIIDHIPNVAIGTQPSNTTVCQNSNASFTVAATNANSFTWQVNTGSGFNNIPAGAPYAGINTATLNISATPSTFNTYQYRCVVNGPCGGPINSNAATLTVTPTPTATIFGLASTYCINAAIPTLQIFPTGGVLTGPGLGTVSPSGQVTFNPRTAGLGAKTITYTFGCAVVNVNTTVLDTAQTSITSPPLFSYTTNDLPSGGDLIVQVSGSDVSATFSGLGVIGNKFYPNIAGAGSRTVTALHTNASGCISTTTKTFTITDANKGIAVIASICKTGNKITLTENSIPRTDPFIPGIYEFEGYSISPFSLINTPVPGLSRIGTTMTWELDPNLLPNGTVVYYLVRTFFGIRAEARQTVTINDVQTPSFNLPASVCNTALAINMSPSVTSPGSAFTVLSPASPPSGLITGNSINPNTVTSTTAFSIRYRFENASGCIADTIKNITIYSKPAKPTLNTASGQPDKLYTICSGDTIKPWKLDSTGLRHKWYDNPSLNTTIDTALSFKARASVNIPTTTNYYVLQELGIGCISDTIRLTFVVNSGATIIPITSESVCAKSSKSLSVRSTIQPANIPLPGVFSGGSGTWGLDQLSGFDVVNTYTPDESEIPTGTNVNIINLTFTSNDPDGSGPCLPKSNNFTLTINPLPIIDSIYFEPFKGSFCKNDPKVNIELSVRPSDPQAIKVFSDKQNGVVGNEFLPAIANIGLDTLIATYTNSKGCVNKDTIDFYVYGLPTFGIQVTNRCAGAPTQFRTLNPSVPGDPNSSVTQYNWNFGDNNTTNDFSNDSTDTYTYTPTLNLSAVDFYQTRLIVRTNRGCQTQKDSTVEIGNTPNAAFTWSKICPSDNTEFQDLSGFPPLQVTEYRWNFGDGSPLLFGNTSSEANPIRKLRNSPGQYDVKFRIRSRIGCIDSTTQKVFILGEYTPTASSPYAKEFSDSNHFWAPSGQNSSWEWAQATGKANLNTDKKVWITNATGTYNVSESSFLDGPCIDMTNLERPMIALRIRSGTQFRIGGTVLQYSEDGGANWQLLGGLNEGENWYDTSGVFGNPGNQALNQYAWTGTYPEWTVARIPLNNLADNPSVRFRLAFGSPNLTEGLSDGFAFDSVWIGDRDKVMLLEQFTNTTASVAKNKAAEMITLLNSRAEDVVPIFYHTPFGGPDPFYTRNQGQNGARILRYGIASAPFSVLDGNYYYGNNLTPAQIDRRSLSPAKLKIDLNSTITGESIEVAVKVTSKENIQDDFATYIAILEQETSASIPGTFNYVFARFLPDAGGFVKEGGADAGEIFYYTTKWAYTPFDIYEADELAVVVFTQNLRTQEIFQAAYQFGNGGTLTPVNEAVIKSRSYQVYPNPAADAFYISTLEQETDFRLLDQNGNLVLNGNLESGISGIQTDGLAAGLYVLYLGNPNTGYETLKIMIQR